MTRESLYAPEPIFRETFNSEFDTRKNGGRKDLTGESFGDLKVIRLNGKTSSGVNKWLCECICGKFTSVRSYDLRSGKTKSCGCLRSRKAPPIDLSGKVFNKLTVIDYSYRDKGRIFWNCLCECGNTSVCVTATLNSGGATQCYACGRKFNPKGQSGRTALYRQYKHDAKKRGYGFNLSKDDFKELTSQNCIYCGQEPSHIIKTNTTDNHGDYVYNGIYRVDNNKGYEIDNCVTCCRLCNWMKRDLTTSEFKNHIQKIINNMENQDE